MQATGEAEVFNSRHLRDSRDDIRDRGVERGRAHAKRAVLDQDVLGRMCS